MIFTEIAESYRTQLVEQGASKEHAQSLIEQSTELYRDTYEAFYSPDHSNDPNAREFTLDYEIVIKGQAMIHDYCPEVYINGELRDVGPHYHLPIDRLAEIVKSYCDGLLQGEIMCRSFGRAS